MMEAHVGTSGDEGREVLGIMGGAGSAAVEYDGVVEKIALVFLVALEALEEVGQLLAQEAIVLGEIELTIFVLSMGKVMVSTGRNSELDRESIGDAHPIFAIEHEGDATGDVGVKGQSNEVEHGLVILGRICVGSSVKIQVGAILLFERDVDPLFGGLQTAFDFVE